MKKLILLIMLLIPTSGYCLSGATYKAQAQVIIDQKNAEKQIIVDKQIAEKNAERQAYLNANGGAGYVFTKEVVDALKQSISQKQVVQEFDAIRNDKGVNDRRSMINAIAGAKARITDMYPGSNMNLYTGSGHLIQNNETIDYVSWNLFKYTLDADNGLHYVYTFANPIVTVKISDGTNMILLKINMVEPNKSRVSDGNLPVNAMNTITQVYAKKGIQVSDKMLMTLIENWYKAELMPSGKTLQDTVTGLLVDVDARSDFIKFVKSQAKVAVKPVDDDE